MVADAVPTAPRWELYRVLSEPLRLRLLALAAEEELAVGELAELLRESQPNVSRHAALLKQAGLIAVRRHGTRTLLRTTDDTKSDPVVSDALASGRALCAADESLARIADVVQARDSAAREFFSRPAASLVQIVPPELGVYLAALGQLLPRRSLAIDAGTGDGGLLHVLAPVFERVIAVDRSLAQLSLARERAALGGYSNVLFVEGELDATEVVLGAERGADAVFAVRLLHHAASPAKTVEHLANLCGPGGTLVVLDYAAHDDESMRDQADLWLGFDPLELSRFARSAGLVDSRVLPVPVAMNGRGPDAHLSFLLLVARKRESKEVTNGQGKRHGLTSLPGDPRAGLANARKAMGHG
jgi:ArsR family transcriptional regulator